MKTATQSRFCLTLILLGSCSLGLAQTPKPVDAQRQTAMALEQQGKNVEAEAAWQTVLKVHPTSPEAYAHLGLLEARQEHYREAVPLYRKALALGPKVPSVQINLGLALFKSGALKECIAEFEPLLKSLPGDSPQAQQITILIGMAAYGLGRYTEAAPYLKDAAAHDPRSLPLRLALAHSYLWSKQFSLVMDVYGEILDIDPNSAEADMIAGEAMDEMKDHAGAIKMFQAAVLANPKEPDAHFGLGYLLWTQKQYPEAANEFKEELANDPEHQQATLYLADTEIKMNQNDAARPLLEKVARLNPALGLAHLDLGIVYSEDERTEDALRELKVAASLIPQEVDVHWRLGRLYRSIGKKDEAKIEFDKASQLNKAADNDLARMLANGRPKPVDAQEAAPTVK